MQPDAGRAVVPNVCEAAAPRYRAFLSYSHADTAWAKWLMKKLEGYRVSTRFHGRAAPVGTLGPRLAPVFRDRDELPTTSDLGETIRGALRASATLIVICSPNSATPRWVQEEICAFKRLNGDGRATAFMRLVAGLLGVGFDELRQRELQRRNRGLGVLASRLPGSNDWRSLAPAAEDLMLLGQTAAPSG